MANNTGLEFENKDWKEFVKKIKKNLDANKLADVASPITFKDIIEHFQNEQGPQGPWKKWSLSYVLNMLNSNDSKKESHARGGKKLQFTGRLRNSIVPKSGRFTNRNMKITNTESKKIIKWFSNAKTKDGFPYAAAHNDDSTVRKKLPQRKFLWLSKSALDKITKSYLKYITEKN